MNWAARILWRAAKFAGAHPRDPLIAEWFGGAKTASGAHITPDNAMEVPAVYAAVNVIAETVASLPLIIYRNLGEGSKERDQEHPLYELLHNQPNRWQTSYEWMQMMLTDAMLRGTSYSVKIATGARAISELIPLNARRVRPVLLDEQGRILQEMAPGATLVYWYTPPSGQGQVILAAEMLRISGILSHGLVAQSPIELHKEAVGLAVAAQEYGSRFFENDARPGGAVKIPGTFKDEEAIKRFRERWRAAQGGEKKHSVGVLEGGAEWVDISMSNQDAQFLETRKHQVADIARIMSRVPLHMIGELDRATFSNIEQQSIEFVRYTLRPWLKKIEKTIRRDLFDIDDWKRTHAVEFLTDALLSGETLARFRAYSIARQWGWMSANDVRRKENENPIDGGDAYLTPLNMVDAGKNTADEKDDDDPPAKPNGKGNGNARSLQ